MKLQMKDLNGTVITSIKRLSGKDHWNGVYKTMFEDGSELLYSDRNIQNKDWQKLINKDSGFKMSWRPYMSDEDKGEANATYKHGAIVYASLNDSGTGRVMVWDDINKKLVEESELISI